MTVLSPSLPPYRVTMTRMPLPAPGEWAGAKDTRWPQDLWVSARAVVPATPTAATPAAPIRKRRRLTSGVVGAGRGSSFQGSGNGRVAVGAERVSPEWAGSGLAGSGLAGSGLAGSVRQGGEAKGTVGCSGMGTLLDQLRTYSGAERARPTSTLGRDATWLRAPSVVGPHPSIESWVAKAPGRWLTGRALRADVSTCWPNARPACSRARDVAVLSQFPFWAQPPTLGG